MNPRQGATRPACALCGGAGDVIHRNLRDRLFGADGLWNFCRCRDRSCGLVWLDPTPTTDELKQAYAAYYTHVEKSTPRAGLAKRILTKMEQGYWAAEFGYPSGGHPALTRMLGRIFPCFPLRRRAADGAVRHLAAVPGGRLLDVGCGSGNWLRAMAQRGWLVSGVDFDEQAVAVARQSGLDVHCGTVEERIWPAESFDAVTLHHVIEHLPDPAGTLAECRRLLKPGGRLAVYTPNAASLSHRAFREHWRGLEPPRHLQVFSLPSLRRILEQAGFRSITLRPVIAPSVISESLMLRWGCPHSHRARCRRWAASGAARLFNLLELGLLAWTPSVADCINAVAVKATLLP